ncbi:MAG: hypothetical protein ACKE5M_00440 [Methylophilaceae bacterium]
MPFVGLGLHFLIAIFFAVHALKNGRQMYWIIILFSFPLLGSIVYFFAEYLPSSKLERGVKQASSKAIQLIDPTKELRAARQAFDLTPTIQNRMRLAAALDNAGEYAEAASEFDACLEGPFASDSEVCFGAAKAKFHIQEAQQAIQLLQNIRNKNAEFRPEQLSILLAQCYAENNDEDSAQKEFVYAYQTFGSAEVRAQYALWAANTGDMMTAERLKNDLDKDWKRWNKHSRNMHRDTFRKLDAAMSSSSDANTQS